MSLLDKLNNHEKWIEFLEYKTEKELLSKSEHKEFEEFIFTRSYEKIASKIACENYEFSIPKKHSINKVESSKKRIVYTFNKEENMILKFLCFLLYDYDYLFCDNLFSFRKGRGAKQAFHEISIIKNLNKKYIIKFDIHDYFNSINIDKLFPLIEHIFTEDYKLCFLLKYFLKDDSFLENDILKHGKRGVMAGTPISVFFANIYLSEMDYFFHEHNIDYFRYSDDIIIFCDESQIDFTKSSFINFINQKDLEINELKSCISLPGEGFTYLGFSYKNNVTDISPITKNKLTAKVRRQARSFYRWRLRKNVDPYKTLYAFNKKLNNKLYSKTTGNELCWSRWFFPMINTDISLKQIDSYIQEWERYIITGKHTKNNFKLVPYEKLTQCGYKPLVHAYYESKSIK